MQGEALADAYAALDVFTFASHSDTQGIVLAEAMAAGLPIVALDAPGAREAVTDGSNGILLPAASCRDEYAAAIGLAVRDRARMGAASRERALRYDRGRTAGEMLALYAGLLDDAASMRADAGGAGRLRAEWRLISTKAAATIKAVTEKR
jgi:glycosyltransferase involved in cell wall biosynthesis